MFHGSHDLLEGKLTRLPEDSWTILCKRSLSIFSARAVSTHAAAQHGWERLSPLWPHCSFAVLVISQIHSQVNNTLVNSTLVNSILINSTLVNSTLVNSILINSTLVNSILVNSILVNSIIVNSILVCLFMYLLTPCSPGMVTRCVSGPTWMETVRATRLTSLSSLCWWKESMMLCWGGPSTTKCPWSLLVRKEPELRLVLHHLAFCCYVWWFPKLWDHQRTSMCIACWTQMGSL